MFKKNQQDSYNVEENPHEGISSSGRGLKIFLITFGVLVVLLGSLVMFARIRTKNMIIESSKIDPVVESVNDSGGEDTFVPGGEELENDILEGNTLEDEVTHEEKYDYENKLIGIKFNYATDMYIKENTDEIFNILKGVTNGEENFDISTHKLDSMLNIIKLTTGNSDGLFITMSLIPFNIVDKVSSTVEGEKSQHIEVETIIDESILPMYDKQIKEALEANGSEIDIFEDSYIKEVNGRKAIVSERRYTGNTEIQTSTGVVDVIQGLVPVGPNALLITAVTDGRPIEINKVTLFEGILESLTIDSTNK